MTGWGGWDILVGDAGCDWRFGYTSCWIEDGFRPGDDRLDVQLH